MRADPPGPLDADALVLPDLPGPAEAPIRHRESSGHASDPEALWRRVDELAEFVALTERHDLRHRSWAVAHGLRRVATAVAAAAAEAESAQAAYVARESGKNVGARDEEPPSLAEVRAATTAARRRTLETLRVLRERAQWYGRAAAAVADDTDVLLSFDVTSEPRRMSSTIRWAAAKHGAALPRPSGVGKSANLFGAAFSNVSPWIAATGLDDRAVGCLLRAVWVHDRLRRAQAAATEIAEDVALSSETLDTAHDHLRAADGHFAAGVQQAVMRGRAAAQDSRERLQGQLALGGTVLLVPALVAAVYGANVGPFAGDVKLGAATSSVTFAGLITVMVSSAILAGMLVHSLLRLSASRPVPRRVWVVVLEVVALVVLVGTGWVLALRTVGAEMHVAATMLLVSGGLLLVRNLVFVGLAFVDPDRSPAPVREGSR